MRARTRNRLGTSLSEMTIATALIAGVLSLALPALSSIGDAGEEGRAQSWTQADNRQALLRVAREVMNGSLTATDELGSPRFEIVDGADRETLSGRLGIVSTPTSSSATETGTSGSGGMGGGGNYYTAASGIDALGSGARGGTRIGRDRTGGVSGAELDAGAFRPRERYFARNVRLRFQRISGYRWGADGEPVLSWSGWVEYAVQGRRLVRIQDGVTTVISPNTSGFLAERTEAGTVLLTLVTERRTPDGRHVVTHANHAEILPKN